MPRVLFPSLLLVATVSAASLPVAAQDVCRPNALGSVSCLGPAVPPPPPRDAGDNRGIDAVLDLPPPERVSRTLIPARRTNSFGETLLDPGEGGPLGGPCSRGTLGHLRCR